MVAVAGAVLARVAEPLPDDTKPVPGHEPQQVVRAFLVAVDRGELRVFGRTLDRSMIAPVRVEYTYSVDSRIPVIRVFSNLKQPVAAPHHKDCEACGISAVLNDEGGIVETEAHIWSK